METVFNFLSRALSPRKQPTPTSSSSTSQLRDYKKASDDDRTGVLIQTLERVEDTPEDAIVIVGFPYDEGTLRNGGRGGATRGPSTFRRFARILGTVRNPEFNVDITELTICDAGDVPKGLSTLEEAHVELERRVREVVERGGIPFVIGGSNDQSYPNASALLSAVGSQQSVGVVNIDAHLDVRPKKNGQVHSGSPFRLLLQDPRFNPSSSSSSSSSKSGKRKQMEHSHYTPFVEFAAQGSQCSEDHARFVTDNGGQILWLLKDLRGDGKAPFASGSNNSKKSQSNNKSSSSYEPLSVVEQFEEVLGGLARDGLEEEDEGRAVFVSFDLDSVSGADAPGVSCPGTVGLTSEEAFGMCFTAGRCPDVRMMDLSEFNPVVEDYRTGRLVANMFYHFLLGIAERRRLEAQSLKSTSKRGHSSSPRKRRKR